MSPLLTKWLQPLTGSNRHVGLYLEDDAIALSDPVQAGSVTVHAGVTDRADSLKSLLAGNARVSGTQPVYATVALSSREFDTFVLNFTELPDKAAAQEALVRWTLQQRKLLDRSGEADRQLRHQVMGQTKKGIKVLVEMMHGPRHTQVNKLLHDADVLPELLCRAGHFVFNELVESGQSGAPAALVLLEAGMVSVYFWSEAGVLTYYRDYSMQQTASMNHSDVATDVVSIVRRLENTEWSSPVHCVYVASSCFAHEAANTMLEHLAGHAPTQLVSTCESGMARLVLGPET